MLTLNLLLEDARIAPATVAVLLHNTTLQPLRSLMPTLWRDRPDLFAAYQAVHAPQVEATLRARANLASFVPLDGGRHLFAGLFDCTSWSEATPEAIYADPRYDELERVYGATDTTLANNARRTSEVRFDLRPLDALADLRGRLVIATPPGRTYRRLAERFDAPVLAISEVPIHEAAVPGWRDFIVTASQVRALPRAWSDALGHWRGIYCIVDDADGARYVGSAYGVDNILGRWSAHVAGERGITAELRRRDPASFRFSILERVSPDLPAEQVIRLEQTWMDRLHTRRFGLNTRLPTLSERTGND